MRIAFDPIKRDKTLLERGLDFARVGELFSGLTATVQDDRRAYPEPLITAGLSDGRLVVVVWTPIEDGHRVISMRHAHDREAKKWRERMDRPG